MSKTDPERFYRWKDHCHGMEYKCPECGTWNDMDFASPIGFDKSKPPACMDCYNIIMNAIAIPTP